MANNSSERERASRRRARKARPLSSCTGAETNFCLRGGVITRKPWRLAEQYIPRRRCSKKARGFPEKHPENGILPSRSLIDAGAEKGLGKPLFSLPEVALFE